MALVIFLKSKTSVITLHLRYLAAVYALLVFMIIFLRSGRWSDELRIPNFQVYNFFICKLSVFLMDVGFISSTLILASTTMERFLCVAFALKVKAWDLQKISKTLLVVYLMIACLLSIYTFFIYDIVDFFGQKYCMYNNLEVFKKFYTVNVTIVSNCLCGGIILCFTIVKPAILFHQKRQRNRLGSGNTSKKELQVTMMLLTVTSLFILIMHRVLEFFPSHRIPLASLLVS